MYKSKKMHRLSAFDSRINIKKTSCMSQKTHQIGAFDSRININKISCIIKTNPDSFGSLSFFFFSYPFVRVKLIKRKRKKRVLYYG